MTPKSLLRHKLVVSTLADFAPGTHFQRVLPETKQLLDDKKIKKLIITSGKVYYDLYEEREKLGLDDVAIIRTEQYYPFPARELAQEISRYKNAEVIWCQEEPKNMGAWQFIAPRISDVLDELGRNSRLRYVGRPESASPAAGYLRIHEKEQRKVIEDAFATGSGSVLKKVAG